MDPAAILAVFPAPNEVFNLIFSIIEHFESSGAKLNHLGIAS